MNNLLKTAAFIFLSTIALAATFSCQSSSTGTAATSTQKSEETDKYVIPDSIFKILTIDTAHMCSVVDAITLTGKVAFNDENVLKIYPLVSGNISNINAMLGDYVEAGQTLAVIKSIEMAGYSNDLTAAETNLQVSKKNLDATQDMATSGLASQKDLLAAQAAYTQAQSELKRVQSVLKINGGNTQGEYIVRAPISGFIVEKNVTNDMTIRADNGNDLFTISNLKNIWVIANVYESNINQVHLGDSVQVTTLSYPGRIFNGKIDKILNVLDPTNKVMKVRVVLSNPNYALKPEMIASVTVMSNENKQSVCIPSSALIFDNSQYYVLVYNDKSDVRVTPVQILNIVGNQTYIANGLQQGEKIITSQQALLIYNALNS
jgi:cobalt-zinc-cadmium efflux system membrane fusion protein